MRITCDRPSCAPRHPARSVIRAAISPIPLMVLCGTGHATPTPQDYQRSLNLRHDWKHLTRDMPFPATWSDDGKTLYYRKTVANGFAYIAMDARSFRKTPAFDTTRLAPALSSALKRPIPATDLPFETFSIEPGTGHVTFELHDEAWSCDLSRQTCAVIDSGLRPRGFDAVRDLRVAAKNTPQPSPDGQWSAFIRDHNLVLRATRDGSERLLSTDGTTGDFYDPESLRWSPDSRHIALLRVRPGYPRYITRVESSPVHALQPRLQTQLYPKPGDAIDIEQPVLFDVSSGQRTEIDTALFANAYPLSLEDMAWSEDARAFMFPFIRRGYQRAGFVMVDAATGQAHLAADERSNTFVDGDRLYHHVIGKDAESLVWASERSGWRQLYLMDSTNGQIRNAITHGAWPVREILRVDPRKRRIWFGASGMNRDEDPYFVHYYRVDFDGSHLVPLTPEPANHHASLSPDGTRLSDTWSRVDLPARSVLRDAESGHVLTTVETGDDTPLRAAGFHPPEVFHTKGRDGSTDIWGIVVRPATYDPHRRYPVIENIYAGPHGSFVPKDFWPFGYHSGGDKLSGMQELADLGFIVVQIDGMGTANRSRAFHDVAWKHLEDSGFPDRILWHRAMAARDPSYDIGHVGIYGGSAGGQSALNALLFHPEFYKAAVAFAGCYDNRMDKISWNEQWLGWPVDDSYRRASGVENASRLRGRLLMIVGEQDANVDPSSTLQVANALIHAGKDFELLVIPGYGHTAGRSDGPIAYAERREFGFFVRALQGATEPDWNAMDLPLTQDP
ncbi:S9 family peptidase [Brytella acorum]|uniref:DPP IV N-terminal domain-containing protein n=1 Tax=Brytella acorum TaxID=2959299 RepID=A0AA35UEB0_9PROT|nr:S9 family peptidase [Brytella acorum]MDF3625590.1 DPP IV N-terminal domain-containing protein [Brytella acorum]CAI9119457.1 DPP IV N-terminal domain-containing protein [Brytella acorum]